ncbi:MAG TPA: NAD-dependent epimerase/dehydratase family protein [Bacteroidales bacterium]|nr:NAD-dependent epimerase/dehydratase family protein [Bacteroidales bacterium]
MRVFVTGASGYIGRRLVQKLAEEGHDIIMILRNPGAVNGITNKANVLIGDIFNRETLLKGMNDCDWVFHLAAYAKPTSLDRDLPYRTNVDGTKNVIEAAVNAGVKKVVITSTAGTMGFSKDSIPVDEETNKNLLYHTEYERTKHLAEEIAISSATPSTSICIVNPTRVFGPGKLSKSNSMTRIIKLYGKGIWRIIPGDGDSIGNYAFIDDVVTGHIQAAKCGRSGERYILGGENLSFLELFESIGEAYGIKRKMYFVSRENLKRIASMSGKVSRLFGRPALISDNWIDKYLQNWILSSNKAIKEIAYRITPIDEALGITVDWIKSGRHRNGE